MKTVTIEESRNEMYRMKINEEIKVDDVYIRCVPGGWIYFVYDSDFGIACCFVPTVINIKERTMLYDLGD